MTVKRILLLLVWITIGITLLTYFAVIEQRPPFDAGSAVFMVLLGGVMTASLLLANRLAFPLILVLVIYAYQRYVLSGIIMIAFVNDDIGVFTNYRGFSATEYNRSLGYAVLGYAGIALGVLLGAGRVPRWVDGRGLGPLMRDESGLRLSSWVLAAFTTVQVGLNLHSLYILGQTYVGINAESEGGWWRLFYNYHIPLSIASSILYFQWNEIKRVDRYVLFYAIGILLLSSVLSGSRGFIYCLLVNYLLIYFVIKGGDALVRPRVGVVLSVLLAIVVIFPVATWLRYKDTVGQQEWVGGMRGTLQGVYGREGQMSSAVALSVLQRLNSFETSMSIMNDRNMTPIDPWLSPSFILGRIVNNLVPGEVFGGLIDPQYLYDFLYFSKFSGWNAYDWGIWEEAYLIFGYWPAILALGLGSAAVGWTWRMIVLSRWRWKLFYVAFFVYTFWQRLLINYEVSLIVSSVLTGLFVFHVTYLGLKWITEYLKLPTILAPPGAIRASLFRARSAHPGAPV
jgi:hypothetical protein